MSPQDLQCNTCLTLRKQLGVAREWNKFYQQKLDNHDKMLHMAVDYEREKQHTVELQLAYDQRTREATYLRENMTTLLLEVDPLKEKLAKAEAEIVEHKTKREKAEDQVKGLQFSQEQLLHEVKTLRLNLEGNKLESLEKKLCNARSNIRRLKIYLEDKNKEIDLLRKYQDDRRLHFERINKRSFWAMKLASSLAKLIPDDMLRHHNFPSELQRLNIILEVVEKICKSQYINFHKKEEERLKSQKFELSVICPYEEWLDDFDQGHTEEAADFSNDLKLPVSLCRRAVSKEARKLEMLLQEDGNNTPASIKRELGSLNSSPQIATSQDLQNIKRESMLGTASNSRLSKNTREEESDDSHRSERNSQFKKTVEVDSEVTNTMRDRGKSFSLFDSDDDDDDDDDDDEESFIDVPPKTTKGVSCNAEAIEIPPKPSKVITSSVFKRKRQKSCDEEENLTKKHLPMDDVATSKNDCVENIASRSEVPEKARYPPFDKHEDDILSSILKNVKPFEKLDTLDSLFKLPEPEAVVQTLSEESEDEEAHPPVFVNLAEDKCDSPVRTLGEYCPSEVVEKPKILLSQSSEGFPTVGITEDTSSLLNDLQISPLENPTDDDVQEKSSISIPKILTQSFNLSQSFSLDEDEDKDGDDVADERKKKFGGKEIMQVDERSLGFNGCCTQPQNENGVVYDGHINRDKTVSLEDQSQAVKELVAEKTSRETVKGDCVHVSDKEGSKHYPSSHRNSMSDLDDLFGIISDSDDDDVCLQSRLNIGPGKSNNSVSEDGCEALENSRSSTHKSGAPDKIICDEAESDLLGQSSIMPKTVVVSGSKLDAEKPLQNTNSSNSDEQLDACSTNSLSGKQLSAGAEQKISEIGRRLSHEVQVNSPNLRMSDEDVTGTAGSLEIIKKSGPHCLIQSSQERSQEAEKDVDASKMSSKELPLMDSTCLRDTHIEDAITEDSEVTIGNHTNILEKQTTVHEKNLVKCESSLLNEKKCNSVNESTITSSKLKCTVEEINERKENSSVGKDLSEKVELDSHQKLANEVERELSSIPTKELSLSDVAGLAKSKMKERKRRKGFSDEGMAKSINRKQQNLKQNVDSKGKANLPDQSSNISSRLDEIRREYWKKHEDNGKAVMKGTVLTVNKESGTSKKSNVANNFTETEATVLVKEVIEPQFESNDHLENLERVSISAMEGESKSVSPETLSNMNKEQSTCVQETKVSGKKQLPESEKALDYVNVDGAKQSRVSEKDETHGENHPAVSNKDTTNASDLTSSIQKNEEEVECNQEGREDLTSDMLKNKQGEGHCQEAREDELTSGIQKNEEQEGHSQGEREGSREDAFIETIRIMTRNQKRLRRISEASSIASVQQQPHPYDTESNTDPEMSPAVPRKRTRSSSRIAARLALKDSLEDTAYELPEPKRAAKRNVGVSSQVDVEPADKDQPGSSVRQRPISSRILKMEEKRKAFQEEMEDCFKSKKNKRCSESSSELLQSDAELQIDSESSLQKSDILLSSETEEVEVKEKSSNEFKVPRQKEEAVKVVPQTSSSQGCEKSGKQHNLDSQPKLVSFKWATPKPPVPRKCSVRFIRKHPILNCKHFSHELQSPLVFVIEYRKWRRPNSNTISKVEALDDSSELDSPDCNRKRLVPAEVSIDSSKQSKVKPKEVSSKHTVSVEKISTVDTIKQGKERTSYAKKLATRKTKTEKLTVSTSINGSEITSNTRKLPESDSEDEILATKKRKSMRKQKKLFLDSSDSEDELEEKVNHVKVPCIEKTDSDDDDEDDNYTVVNQKTKSTKCSKENKKTTAKKRVKSQLLRRAERLHKKSYYPKGTQPQYQHVTSEKKLVKDESLKRKPLVAEAPRKQNTPSPPPQPKEKPICRFLSPVKDASEIARRLSANMKTQHDSKRTTILLNNTPRALPKIKRRLSPKGLEQSSSLIGSSSLFKQQSESPLLPELTDSDSESCQKDASAKTKVTGSRLSESEDSDHESDSESSSDEKPMQICTENSSPGKPKSSNGSIMAVAVKSEQSNSGKVVAHPGLVSSLAQIGNLARPKMLPKVEKPVQPSISKAPASSDFVNRLFSKRVKNRKANKDSDDHKDELTPVPSTEQNSTSVNTVNPILQKISSFESTNMSVNVPHQSLPRSSDCPLVKPASPSSSDNVLNFYGSKAQMSSSNNPFMNESTGLNPTERDPFSTGSNNCSLKEDSCMTATLSLPKDAEEISHGNRNAPKDLLTQQQPGDMSISQTTEDSSQSNDSFVFKKHVYVPKNRIQTDQYRQQIDLSLNDILEETMNERISSQTWHHAINSLCHFKKFEFYVSAVARAIVKKIIEADPYEKREYGSGLSPSLFKLFQAMTLFERRHSFPVAYVRKLVISAIHRLIVTRKSLRMNSLASLSSWFAASVILPDENGQFPLEIFRAFILDLMYYYPGATHHSILLAVRTNRRVMVEFSKERQATCFEKLIHWKVLYGEWEGDNAIRTSLIKWFCTYGSNQTILHEDPLIFGQKLLDELSECMDEAYCHNIIMCIVIFTHWQERGWLESKFMPRVTVAAECNDAVKSSKFSKLLEYLRMELKKQVQ